VASYFDLSNHEREAMNVMLQFVKRKLDERFHPDGYNIGINVNRAGGQTVFHCHMHLIPRYEGDVDDPKGGVRGVIPDKQKYNSVEGQPNPIVYSDDPVEKAPKPSMMERSQERHGNAYQPWDEEGDALLLRMYAEHHDIKFLAEVFERSSGSIRHRLKRLGVLED
jgi:diadenosine tetraphosphate (Ap4A) HIT family hydrolase